MIWFAITVAGLGYILLLSAFLFTWSPTKLLLVDKAVEEAKIKNGLMKHVLFLHKKNSEILSAVGKQYETLKQLDIAIRLYDAAIRHDPKNFEYQQEYLRLIFENGLFSQAGTSIKQFSLNMLPNSLHNKINSVPLTSPALITAWPSIAINTLESNPPDLYFAKLYYVLGLNILSQDPGLTKSLWQMAKGIYPDMGLLHHELASLELYVFHNLPKAQKIISTCMQLPHAALHCKQLKVDLSNIPIPGYVANDIWDYK